MARIERNDAIAMFFPVWWWSMPATLKGWIDRVWNHGWAYGWNGIDTRIPLDKALMVAREVHLWKISLTVIMTRFWIPTYDPV